MGRSKNCDDSIEEDWKRHHKGYLPSIDHCSAACLGISQWFVYGKSDNGNDKCTHGCCNGQGCQCICKAGSLIDDGAKGLSCDFKDDFGFDVYSIPDSEGIIISEINIIKLRHFF